MASHVLQSFVRKELDASNLAARLMGGQRLHTVLGAALSKGVAGATGLEPATSAVTGQRSNQLSYAPVKGERKVENRSRGVNC